MTQGHFTAACTHFNCFRFRLCFFSSSETQELGQGRDGAGRQQVRGGGPLRGGGRETSGHHQVAGVSGGEPLDEHHQQAGRHGDGPQRVPAGPHGSGQRQGGHLHGGAEDPGAALDSDTEALCGV